MSEQTDNVRRMMHLAEILLSVHVKVDGDLVRVAWQLEGSDVWHLFTYDLGEGESS